MAVPTRGLPFLKGNTLKFGDDGSWFPKRRVLRVRNAELGEIGSVGFGVFDLIGLPAKA